MENVFMILSQNFGLETVISAVIVCVVMMLVKKLKPKMSPKTELVIRLAVSVIVHLLFILILGGDYAKIPQGAMSVCGVSMILGSATSKTDKGELKEQVSKMLPDFDKEQLDKVLEVDESVSPSGVTVEIAEQSSYEKPVIRE